MGSVACSLNVIGDIRAGTWHKLRIDVPVRAHSMLEKALPNAILDLGDRIPKLLGDSLTLERVDSIRVGRSGHDDKRDNGYLRSRLL